MRIDKVILATDDNVDYYPFWNIVSKGWKRIGIEPILYFVGSEDDIYKFGLKNDFGQIKVFKPIPNISTAFQAQNIRILLPALYKDENIMISDIDSFPINGNYYHDNAKFYDDRSFVVYRSDVCGKDQISIMWNLAKGKVWSDVFNIETENDVRERIKKWYPSNYKMYTDMTWFTDQIKLREYIENWEYKDLKCVFLNDKITGFYRLDRLQDGNRHTTNLNLDDVFKYTDFHMPRPYEKALKVIRPLLNKLEM